MIRRLVTMITVLALAYLLIAKLAPYLPTISVKRPEAPKPATLQQAISLYLVHDKTDQVELLQASYPADWDTNQPNTHLLYELAGLVPTSGDRYASSGYQIEENYESFLLSIRPGDDPHYEELLEAYKRARTNALVPPGRKKGKADAQTRQELQTRTLTAMVTYLEASRSGPTAPRLGKALRMFYGERQSAPKIKFPSGDERNLQRIDTAPSLANVNSHVIEIPTIDFIVPATVIDTDKTLQTAQATSLKLAELTIVRPWLDLDLLSGGTRMTWNGSPPNFFGQSGTLARIPIRLVLAQEPEVEAPTAKVDVGTSGSVSIGPFSYAASEIKTDGKLLQLRPTRPHWVILAIVSKEL